MKKDENNLRIEDFNVWEPEDPKKPYLIQKEDEKSFQEIYDEIRSEKLKNSNFKEKKVQLPFRYDDSYLIREAKRKWREKCAEWVESPDDTQLSVGFIWAAQFVIDERGKKKSSNKGFSAITINEECLIVDIKPTEQFFFRYCDFLGDFQIYDSIFAEKVFFNGSIFHKNVYLSSCEFKKGIIFHETVIRGCLFMPDQWNPEETIWTKEPFQGLVIKEGGGIILRNCYFPEGFTLRNLNLKNSLFRGSNIEKIRFVNCTFTEEKGNFFIPARLTLADEYQEKLQKVWKGGAIPENSELANMYQLMKKSFEEQKDYQTAGKFYVSEMVFRQKEATGLKKFFLSAYGFLAGYGESVWRTGFFLLFCLLFSGFLPFIASLFSSALSSTALLLSSHCSCTSIDSFFHSLQALFDVLKSGSTKLLLLGSSEEKTWADIISRSLFIVSGFLFINAIRRRLRRS